MSCMRPMFRKCRDDVQHHTTESSRGWFMTSCVFGEAAMWPVTRNGLYLATIQPTESDRSLPLDFWARSIWTYFVREAFAQCWVSLTLMIGNPQPCNGARVKISTQGASNRRGRIIWSRGSDGYRWLNSSCRYDVVASLTPPKKTVLLRAVGAQDKRYINLELHSRCTRVTLPRYSP